MPSAGRLLLGMQVARIAQSMVSVTIVLFALAVYRSAALAGAATFFSIFPGLLVSPIAGALLDRHGRTRLVTIDYLLAFGCLALLGTLAFAGSLPAWLLIAIAAIASLTAPLSATGLRSLFPLIVPSHLWERVNAVDSTGYVVAAIVGPPLAAAMVAQWGGPATFLAIGLSYFFAALVITRIPDPPTRTVSSGNLLRDAWQGLVYTWGNRTLRGLGFSISVLNLARGTLTILVPVIILERLHYSAMVVGLVIAAQGVAGLISAFVFGRQDTRGRERLMAAVPMAASSIVIAMLLVKSSLVTVVLVMVITGALDGPTDIALFTLRQRRTDPSWMGRAFAVSMAFNYVGSPIGSAFAGAIAARSLETALVFGTITALLSGILMWKMVPPGE